MLRVGSYVFKRAETRQEFEQIHRLNYRTFVHEIPQHSDPGNGQLVDKFHDKNAYFIVVREDRLVGMVSSHDQPPFSVADRLTDPEILVRPGTRPLEIRLLALEPDTRNSTVFFGLMWSLYEYARSNGYTHLYISGLQEREMLYKRLGFEVIGDPVPSGKALFIPMVLTIGQLPKKTLRVKHLWESHMQRIAPSLQKKRSNPVCLLPGPVTIAPAISQAFHQPPIYHRGPEFIALFQKVRRTLGELVGGRDVAVFNGSGTLANETVAAALAAGPQPGRGILLVNGEFGQRLARQATRFGLQPRILEWSWGQAWDLEEVETALAQEPVGSWIWGVHLESSTGILNDLSGLVQLATGRRVRVCVDCISSLGAVPLDLRNVYLATGATGKSLGSYAGVAIVFADATLLTGLDMGNVPSYFDIPAALASEGPRFTFPSPSLMALDAALAAYADNKKAQARFDHYRRMGAYVRHQLRILGLEPLAAEEVACPVVTTFAPPNEESSEEFVARCRSWGFSIGGQSGYLAQRRLIQIATMGATRRDDCAPLFEHLAKYLIPETSLMA
jgi:aspartate aminotransferase-like enzyme/N-acyl-L-homoserine lactone synthetase